MVSFIDDDERNQASRAVLTIRDVSAQALRGVLRWTSYAGSPFVLQDAVLRTDKNGT